MTLEAALALALACHSLPASLAPIMVGIAQHENPSLDPEAVNHNANGTTDVGLAQVNSGNFGWLGLTMQTAMDPCVNLTAGARVLFVRYNGDPPDRVKALYSAGVMTRLARATPKPPDAVTQDAESTALEDAPSRPETLHMEDHPQ